jgi:uncharacterized membrane protein YhfC
MFYSLTAALISCSIPLTLCLVLKYKFNAKIFPLLVGVFSYMVIISLPRGALKLVILGDDLKQIPWLYYLISAFISGLFEEVGRYIVFKQLIPKYDNWTDCILYGIGHCTAEAFLTHNIFENTINDAFLESYMLLQGIGFSVSMTVLVFSAVHYFENKKLLYTAVIIHTVTDVFMSLYYLNAVTIGEFMIIEIILTIAVCVFAYIIYRNAREKLP